MPHLPAFFHVATEIASVDRQFLVPSSLLLELEELLAALPTTGLAFAGQVTTLKKEINHLQISKFHQEKKQITN